MAGHSKFKNIMYRKGAQDKKRASLFAKLSREIMVATKQGGADPDANNRLRLAVQTARSNSMPKDNIERAIKKGDGGGEADNYEEMRYEGYGPGGVAVIVECLSDNRNRTASEVRAAFAKSGGAMGESGSVSFMFDRVGEILYPTSVGDGDHVLEAAINAGADDVISSDEGHEIICSNGDLHSVSNGLGVSLGEANSVRLVWRAQNTIPLNEEKAISLFKFIDVLDDNDDVQQVTANFDIADEIMEKLSS